MEKDAGNYSLFVDKSEDDNSSTVSFFQTVLMFVACGAGASRGSGNWFDAEAFHVRDMGETSVPRSFKCIRC